MGGLRMHLVVYLAINSLLVAIWALTGTAGGFWPVWPMISWGAALAIHAGAVTASRPALPRATRSPLPPAEERSLPGPRPGGHRRKWVAVMFVDIVGSTRLNESLGDEEWHGVLAFHRARVRAAVAAWRGEEVGTAGDGSLARFDHPADAVGCAVDIQRLVQEEAEAGEPPAPPVRIGIHAGEVLQADQDLLGRVVNLASRVADEASAAEILVTETVADQLDGGLDLEDRGLRPLKGMDRARHLFAVAWASSPRPSLP